MKLETKDLMIGNILDFNGMECVVKEIDDLGVVVSIEETTEEEWIDIFQFTGSSINEEWLLSLGFFKSSWDNLSSYRLMIGENDYSIIMYSNNICEIGDIVVKEVLYKHQLQNLINIIG